ncbi:ORF4 [Bearded dragon adenovirus 1]|uniref:ORF4 n=1 Tax=Bearded dragon adenovirus 1 TaxID=2729647 RepID=A0A6M4MJC7_9ADEN|nr:ORF4 [Bearded dragon adenovirus 1]QJR83112.1 ORF4 [Bearded dragon adenovirus 1]
MGYGSTMGDDYSDNEGYMPMKSFPAGTVWQEMGAYTLPAMPREPKRSRCRCCSWQFFCFCLLSLSAVLAAVALALYMKEPHCRCYDGPALPPTIDQPSVQYLRAGGGRQRSDYFCHEYDDVGGQCAFYSGGRQRHTWFDTMRVCYGDDGVVLRLDTRDTSDWLPLVPVPPTAAPSPTCPPGWYMVKGTCYFASKLDQRTWKGAKDFCLRSGGRLAEFRGRGAADTGHMVDQRGNMEASWVGGRVSKAVPVWDSDRTPIDPKLVLVLQKGARYGLWQNRGLYFLKDYMVRERGGKAPFYCMKAPGGAVPPTIAPESPTAVATTQLSTVSSPRTPENHPLCEKGWVYFSGNCFFYHSSYGGGKEATKYCHKLGAEVATLSTTDEKDFFEKFSPVLWVLYGSFGFGQNSVQLGIMTDTEIKTQAGLRAPWLCQKAAAVYDITTIPTSSPSLPADSSTSLSTSFLFSTPQSTEDPSLSLSTPVSTDSTSLNTPSATPRPDPFYIPFGMAFSSSCPGGWWFFPVNKRCYFFSGEAVHTWAEAARWCKNQGGHLAGMWQLKDGVPMAMVASDVNSDFWIGLRKHGKKAVNYDGSPVPPNVTIIGDGGTKEKGAYGAFFMDCFFFQRSEFLKRPWLCSAPSHANASRLYPSPPPLPTDVPVPPRMRPKCPPRFYRYMGFCWYFSSTFEHKAPWLRAKSWCANHGSSMGIFTTRRQIQYASFRMAMDSYGGYVGLVYNNSAVTWIDGRPVDTTFVDVIYPGPATNVTQPMYGFLNSTCISYLSDGRWKGCEGKPIGKVILTPGRDSLYFLCMHKHK